MPEWRVIGAIVRKDIGVWLRQPATIAATLLPPLAFMLAVFFSASAVGRNPVALVIEDQGPHAKQLATVLTGADAFVVRRATAQTAADMLERLEVEAVITIPPTFDAAYTAHRPDPVTIEVNNLNLDFTNDLRRSLPAAITEFYRQQNPSPIAVEVQETDLRQQDVGLIQFQLIPMLVLLLTIAGVVNAGLATSREWEEQTIKELLLAPIRRGSVIAGKILAGWLTTLFVAAVVLVLGAASGYLRPAPAFWLPTLTIVAAIALMSVGVGVAFGALLRRFQSVSAVGINLALYLFFLSGGISVAAFLPAWVQRIARVIPTYYGVHALQMAIFYSSSDGFGRDLLVLAGTAAVTLALGIVLVRRRALA